MRFFVEKCFQSVLVHLRWFGRWVDKICVGRFLNLLLWFNSFLYIAGAMALQSAAEKVSHVVVFASLWRGWNSLLFWKQVGILKVILCFTLFLPYLLSFNQLLHWFHASYMKVFWLQTFHMRRKGLKFFTKSGVTDYLVLFFIFWSEKCANIKLKLRNKLESQLSLSEQILASWYKRLLSFFCLDTTRSCLREERLWSFNLHNW